MKCGIFGGEVLYISITPMHFFPVDTLWDGVSTPSAKPWVSQKVFGAARNTQLWRLNVTNNYNINQHYHWPTIDHHYITTRLLIRWKLLCTINHLLTITIIYTTILKHWKHFFCEVGLNSRAHSRKRNRLTGLGCKGWSFLFPLNSLVICIDLNYLTYWHRRHRPFWIHLPTSWPFSGHELHEIHRVLWLVQGVEYVEFHEFQ